MEITNHVAADDFKTSLKLSPYLELLEDVEGSLTIDQVSASPLTSHFGPGARATPNLGFTASAWWVRFTLVNRDSDAQTLMLRQDYPLIDYVDLWHKDEQGNWQQRQTGDRRAFSDRDLQHRDFIFPLHVPGGASATYYLRFASSGPIDISLKLYQQAGLFESLGLEQLVHGMYFGGFLVLVIYNFSLFVVVRERVFFDYLIYVMSYGLYIAGHSGLSFQFLWPNSPWWGNQSLLLFLAVSILWALQFSRGFLNLSSIAPKLDRIAFILQAFAAVGFIGGLVLPYALVIVPMALLTLVVTVVILAMGSTSLLAGYKPARYFMAAWTMLLLGVLVYMLKTFGLLPHTFVTQYGFQIGSLLEMVLLSLALASRVNDLQHQSRTDPLTQLANRRFFDERLAREFERGTRYEQLLSLLIIDIDHFKRLNDRLGHLKGDEAIRAMATLLTDSARGLDVIARYGGEEFAMILPGTDNYNAVVIAERLRSRVEKEVFAGERLTVSIGLSSLPDPSISTVNEFFEAADHALYTAKTGGRNRVADSGAKMPVKKIA